MSAPDPQHIDAVADVDCMPLRRCVGTLTAHRILDSTDPAVHAAMLDALTRHGVLTEEAHRRCTGCGATDSRDVPFILSHFMHDMAVTPEDAPEVVERRLVTSWEVPS